MVANLKGFGGRVLPMAAAPEWFQVSQARWAQENEKTLGD
jgi:hypothetical protein